MTSSLKVLQLKFGKFFICPMHATCTFHLIPFELITLTILDEENYEALQYVISSILALLLPSWLQIFYSVLFSETFSVHVPYSGRDLKGNLRKNT